MGPHSDSHSDTPKTIPPRHAKNRGPVSIAFRVFQVFWKAFWSIFLIAVITGIVCMIAMLMYLYSLKDTRANVDLNAITLNETSYVYSQNTSGEWVEAAQFHGVENREWTDLDDIPDTLINAFISTEDKRFRTHHGVDWIRTGFAVLNTFTSQSSMKQGGSTLTQQLIKNLTNDNSISINRKLREIFSALNLEKDYSKDQILEAYLNLINLGNGSYGVGAAAQTYFNKSVSDLTLIECAAIAGITQNPYSYNPIYYPMNNTVRRNDVLYNMYTQGYIEKDEYLAAKYTALKLNPGSGATSSTATVDWYTDLVREEVLSDLVSSGYSPEAAKSLLYQGGLKIYSAVDRQLQDICEKYYITNAASLVPSLPDLQSGIFCMDYQGRVLATVGRRGEKSGNLLWSNATTTKRQPGSSIKPLAVYSPAIELGLVDWSTIIPDEPIELNGKPYPTNAYGFYYGPVTVQFGLEMSANAVSVHIINDYLTVDRGFQFAKYRYHLDTLYERYEQNGKIDTDLTLSSIATGGTLIGTTVQDMTEAYAVFGNGGKYYESYSYYYVEDKDGKILLDNRDPDFEQAISEDSAGVMNKLLQAVVENPHRSTGQKTGRNTAYGARIGSWEIYGKTGSTNNYKDRWFIAGNPYCVGGIWCGYEIARYISGGHHAVTIWKNIMKEYLADKPAKTFDTPDSIVQRWYCTETGQFATSACPEAELGWYKKSSNLGVCTEHTGGYVIRPGSTWVKPIIEEPEEPEIPEEPAESTEPTESQSPSSHPESGSPSSQIIVPLESITPVDSSSDTSE